MTDQNVEEIVFNIKKKDIVAGTIFLHKTSPSLRLLNGVSTFFITILPWINFLTRQDFTLEGVLEALVKTAIFTPAYVISLMIFLPIFTWISTSVLKARQAGVLGEHTIQLREDELTELTSVNESHLKWQGVDGVYQNKNYIFVALGSFRQAHIIPKRAFPSEVAATEFYDRAHNYYKSAQTV